jgi:hypothetical protein
MNKLPTDFETDKYNLHVRLVNEKDANFILQLRTDLRLSKFIHSTDDNINKQIEWIHSYKDREAKGLDYYFIYEYNNSPIGVNRIYNITNTIGTGGSWVCKPNLDVNQVMGTILIMRDILFETLNKEKDIFDVRKRNVHVIKTHQMMGAKIVGESDIDFYFELDREVYLERRCYLLDLLKL